MLYEFPPIRLLLLFIGDTSLIVPLLNGNGGFYDSNCGIYSFCKFLWYEYSVTYFWKPSYCFCGGIFFSFYTDANSAGSIWFIFLLVFVVGDLPYLMYVRLSFCFLSDIVGDLGDLADSLVPDLGDAKLPLTPLIDDNFSVYPFIDGVTTILLELL